MGLVPDQKPWYKHAYLWLVILLPVLAVTVSLWFVTVAFSHQDDVVRDDWYMDGKTLQQDLSRDTVAAQAGLSAQFQIDAQGNINATLTSAQADFSWPATLELRPGLGGGMLLLVLLSPNLLFLRTQQNCAKYNKMRQRRKLKFEVTLSAGD